MRKIEFESLAFQRAEVLFDSPQDYKYYFSSTTFCWLAIISPRLSRSNCAEIDVSDMSLSSSLSSFMYRVSNIVIEEVSLVSDSPCASRLCHLVSRTLLRSIIRVKWLTILETSRQNSLAYVRALIQPDGHVFCI